MKKLKTRPEFDINNDVDFENIYWVSKYVSGVPGENGTYESKKITERDLITLITGNFSSNNFSNANLTFNQNRSHDLAGYVCAYHNAEIKIISNADTSGDVPLLVTQTNGTTAILTVLGNGQVFARGKNNLSSNTAFGENTLAVVTTGNGNSCYGYNAGSALTTAGNNVYFGVNAGALNNQSYNVMIGSDAGYSSTGGVNVVIGYSAGYSVTSVANVLVGGYAGNGLASGEYNTFLGFFAGKGITTGGYNVIIGTEETQPSGLDNSIVIGKGAVATADNQFVIGSSGTNAGTVTTEGFTQSDTWLVRINGQNYKIPLQLIP